MFIFVSPSSWPQVFIHAGDMAVHSEPASIAFHKYVTGSFVRIKLLSAEIPRSDTIAHRRP
jgi:hypothetical protein